MCEWNCLVFVGIEFNCKYLGIIGFGWIGLEFVKCVKVFNMSVYVYDFFLIFFWVEKLGVELLFLDELLVVVDVIIVYILFIKEIKGLFNCDMLVKIKKGVFLLNCVCGGIIDEKVLVYYLEIGYV